MGAADTGEEIGLPTPIQIFSFIDVQEKAAVFIELFNLYFWNTQEMHFFVKPGDLQFIGDQQSIDGGKAVARIDRMQRLKAFRAFGDDNVMFTHLFNLCSGEACRRG